MDFNEVLNLNYIVKITEDSEKYEAKLTAIYLRKDKE